MRWRIAVALGGLGLAACGGSSPADNGVAAKTPLQIVAAAAAALRTVPSVHMTGTARSGGQTVTFDLHILTGKGERGSMSLGGLGMQIVADGGVFYVKPSPAFARHYGGVAAALLEGHWLSAHAAGTGPFAPLQRLSNMNALVAQALARANGAHLIKGGRTTVDGHAVITLTNAARTGHFYVATTGKPYPIELSAPGGEATLHFSEFGATVTLSAPHGAIDISRLLG